MSARTVAVTITIALAVTAAACSDGSTQLATIPPTSAPSASLPPVTIADPTTTTEVATSTSAAVATTVLPSNVVGLSEGGPWKLVDSAPGITSPGLVYELMPKLWAFLPTEESTDDGNLFVPTPADIPIIEAYLQASLVYFRAVTQRPIDLADPGWAQFYGDRGESYFRVLSPKRADGQAVDLDLGVVLRPRVLGEGRTETTAILFDCAFDGGVFRRADGSLAEGSTPGIVLSGTASPMTLGGGRWTVDYVTNQPEAC